MVGTGTFPSSVVGIGITPNRMIELIYDTTGIALETDDEGRPTRTPAV